MDTNISGSDTPVKTDASLDNATQHENDLATPATPSTFGMGAPAPTPGDTPPSPAPISLPTPAEAKQQVSDKVADLKSQATDKVSDIKDQASDLTSQAKDAAGQAISKAKETAVSQVAQQKDRAASSLDEIKSSVQEIAQSFESHGQGTLAGYTNQVASQVEKVAGYLKENDVDALAQDVQAYARQNPALFIGGAFVLGLALARFLKSSERKVASTALVPYTGGDSGMGYMGSTSMNAPRERMDQDSDDAFERGNKPYSANEYVPGGVVGGAPA